MSDTSPTLLPPNATSFERALEQTAAPRIDGLPVLLRTLYRPHECPTQLLPFLAWSLSVRHWNEDWTEQQKRDVCASSIRVHRRHGTIGGVRDALAALNMTIDVLEPRDQEHPIPHTVIVRAYVDGLFLDATDENRSVIADLRAIVDDVAPARCTFLFELAKYWVNELVTAVSATRPRVISTTPAVTERQNELIAEGTADVCLAVSCTRPVVLQSRCIEPPLISNPASMSDDIANPVAVTMTAPIVLYSTVSELAA